jgi:hypothetical protein
MPRRLRGIPLIVQPTMSEQLGQMCLASLGHDPDTYQGLHTRPYLQQNLQYLRELKALEDVLQKEWYKMTEVMNGQIHIKVILAYFRT